MTAICGLIHDGVVYLGGDRGTTNGGSVIPNARPKVWRDGEFVFGTAGSSSFRYLVERCGAPRLDADTDVYGVLMGDWLPRLRALCESYGQTGETGGEPPHVAALDGQVLIGSRGKLYEFGGYGLTLIECSSPMAATGSGGDLTLGALHAWASVLPAPWQPETAIHIALSAAAKFNAYCREPFDIVSVP